MTSHDFDTWRVVYSQFVGADSESGISFALNNVASEAQDSCKFRRKKNGRNGLRKRPMAGMALRDLDPGATVYGFSISLNTINAARNAKKITPESNETHPDTIESQNPPISIEHDVMCDFITL